MKTTYLRGYNTTTIAQHIERVATSRDITYILDDAHSIWRNVISHRAYR